MPARISAVAVFCGSRFGNLPDYRAAAEAMGASLARAGIHLVYGGGDVGLMGTVADAAIAAGGKVTGIIPEFLKAREIMHNGVTDLIVTETMHTRKQKMFALAEAFVVLPGGFGTFDELMEILTWKQLCLHTSPILIVDVAGWAKALVNMLDTAVEQGFASSNARALLEVVPDVESAMKRLCATSSTEATSGRQEERV
ncbi:lysine decarboxylase [Acetobacter estunensis NRIC 0472]|uniref:Cytokinin riboside 5'-monophosphate phosphoribohydrolase n=1 Tax=Acetobacter estunensis TaxID=104097 RepID=A0A967EHM5_9PROT|nr:TIGR00730 family Rossman fold protein [Acetobacter estunensis]NHO53812.1 TIGR00730 family Rossman fold protein [Acetobacter estunensis]GBQ22507.1 lysine decarboxylase [Acetobacter estunensis NRIC 0472]